MVKGMLTFARVVQVLEMSGVAVAAIVKTFFLASLARHTAKSVGQPH
jgi:hypothetical protein